MHTLLNGAYTRLGDAGLGCPDWPTCYGHLIVPDHVDGTTIEGYERPLEATKGWKEMLHRYAAPRIICTLKINKVIINNSLCLFKICR
jgi:cytochrome c oxidase assembly protein subunit 15